MLGTVEAMFEYLDRIEEELGNLTGSDGEQRSGLGLPRYRFVDRSCPTATLSCGAQVKFVFLGREEAKKRAAAVDLTPGSVPAATVNDPDACRRRGLCFPNLVRQEFTLCDQDVIVTRNVAPYGRNHGVVRSAGHEPQSLCFEPFRLAVALSVARALGSETGPSDYEVWVAGEGFNTQWHFHVQFRKQRGPIWTYIDATEHKRDAGLLDAYPSRPFYFQSDDREQLVGALYRELSKFLPIGQSNAHTGSAPCATRLWDSSSHMKACWRVILVRSWYPPGERLFGKQPGLLEHLGEVILESDDEFQRVRADPSGAARILEERLGNGVSRAPGMAMKYVHTNVIARDWRKLAAFYENVFGCVRVLPERDLVGESIARGSGVAGARIQGVHLRLPGIGCEGPTLEVSPGYSELADALTPVANRPGFGHIAFAVDDVRAARDAVLAAGGAAVGTIEVVRLPEAGTITWT